MCYVIKFSNFFIKYNKKCIIFLGEGIKKWCRDWRSMDVGGYIVWIIYC